MINPTIFALSTAPGKAGIAIVRVSGNKSFTVMKALVGTVLIPRKATLCYLTYLNDLIDQAIVICFKANNSYTGEDMVEFHVHGSNAVIKNLSEILGNGFGLLIANPGDFTRRALENGCLDLSQVEGILDLIRSETKAQQKQALKSLSGSIGNKSYEWRELLLNVLSYCEIMIDFSDQDVPNDTTDEIKRSLFLLLNELEKELKSYKSSELVRDGFDIVIIGKPNVGKSSLLNYLAGKEKAIVSEHAGTTRDLLELSIDLGGYRVNFFDTAGIHLSKNIIEQIGIDRAIKKSKEAFIKIFLLENNDLPDSFGLSVEPNDLLLGAKNDVQNHSRYLGVSGKTGKGVNELLEEITKKIKKQTTYSSVLINERHKKIIESTISCLCLAQNEIELENFRIEIVAECVRSAIIQLDLLVGKINVEDVLGNIFSSFCIGK